jgi:hypothetical protein
MNDLSYKIPGMVERWTRRAKLAVIYLAAAFALIVVGHSL